MQDRAFGSDGDLPWATVFDPAANARALSAIQAEGFRAASRIIDRFVRAAQQATEGLAADGGAAGRSGLPDFDRMAQAWWTFAGQFLLGMMPADARVGESGVTLDVTDPEARSAVALRVPVGGSGVAEVWLRNRGSDDHADVRLRCSDLLGHDGEVVAADAVRIDPAVVAMPRRSSRGVTVTITAAAQVRPGSYRGTLLATGDSKLWLPVALTVTPSQT